MKKYRGWIVQFTMLLIVGIVQTYLYYLQDNNLTAVNLTALTTFGWTIIGGISFIILIQGMAYLERTI